MSHFSVSDLKLKRGFTLIELLVVIAIIGILSSVVLASLGTARQKARDATRISDLKNLQQSLELFNDSNQGYPANTDTIADAHHISGADLNAALVPTYIPVMPNDPNAAVLTDEEEYTYEGLSAGVDCNTVATPCESYFLGARLERNDNAVFGSDSGDSIANTAVNGLGVESCDTAASVGVNDSTEQCYSLVP
jgi:prepilin-type N-terminal cleavage/methylation domain-containing protein